MMKIWKDETGQVLVLTTLSMLLLLGFAGMAVDVGMLFHARRNAQIAADAAAVAGALDYKFNALASSATSAAQSAATANGITDTSYLTVNVPPADGPNKGSAGFVEAMVQVPNPTWFMTLFGFNPVNVTARAVAGPPSPSSACIYVLNPVASEAMQVQGSFLINAPGCGVIVDSKSSDALYFGGSAGILNASWVAVVGGDGGQTGDSSPTPITGAAPISDPLGNLEGPAPTNGGCSTTGDGYPGEVGSTDTTTTTLTGTIKGPGAGNAICYTQPVELNNVTLGSGIYVFENGVSTAGSVTSSGATLDAYGGTFTTAANTTLNLVAPTSGQTNGIALMEPPTNTNTITLQIGNSTGTFGLTGTVTGIIYAPNAELLMNDSGGDAQGGVTFNSDIITGTFYDKTTSVTVTSYNAVTPTSPLRKVTLVE
ncbi:MAG: pilus assembly protein TadG-related protein [Acidobacteriota bacterium]